MFAAIVLAAAVTGQPCWDIFGGALQRSAQGRHPAFVSYDERISITGDEQPIIYSLAHVDYRDDGTARVEDQRFNNQPILTNRTEPGPPELGPYGKARSAWLPLEGMDPALPVISNIHVTGNVTCTVAGTEDYKGHNSYHVIFGNARTDRPAIKAVWIDVATRDVWKLIVSGPVLFVGTDGPPPLTDFEVELGYVGPYLVVNHVVWDLRRREYSQIAHYFGEYTLSGFTFPAAMPPAYFGSATQR